MTEPLTASALRRFRKIAVFVGGMTLVGVGVLLLVLPGPGLLTILGGVALLATEFVWAKHWLQRIRQGVQSRLPGAARSPPVPDAPVPNGPVLDATALSDAQSNLAATDAPQELKNSPNSSKRDSPSASPISIKRRV